MIKTKKIVMCDRCGKILEPIKKLEDLASMPYEWYVDKNLFLKYDIYDCKDCRIQFRVRKLKSYYLNILLDIINWFMDNIRLVIWDSWGN